MKNQVIQTFKNFAQTAFISRKSIHPSILRRIRTGILFCAVLIGACGILFAPASDATQLAAELQKNEAALHRQASLAASSHAAQSHAQNGSLTAAQARSQSSAHTGSISVIGDSVFLGAAPAFQKYYKNAVIDAKVSRQVVQALDVAKKMKKNGTLGDTVLIALGTNGNFNSATGQALIDYLGKQRTIYWIDAYGQNLPVQKDVNHTIRRIVKSNSNVHLIAWSKEGSRHPGWFYQDGIHLNPQGQKGFARFIHKKIKD